MPIYWPSMTLPPINLHTVPLLEKRERMEEAKKVPEGHTKVLFVCAQGRLRSATAMHLMNRLYGYNTRCCGVDMDAIIPLNPGLCMWADEIVVMERYIQHRVQKCLDHHGIATQPKCLDIPDEYDYMDEELCSLIQRRYFS